MPKFALSTSFEYLCYGYMAIINMLCLSVQESILDVRIWRLMSILVRWNLHWKVILSSASPVGIFSLKIITLCPVYLICYFEYRSNMSSFTGWLDQQKQWMASPVITTNTYSYLVSYVDLFTGLFNIVCLRASIQIFSKNIGLFYVHMCLFIYFYKHAYLCIITI